MSSRQSIINALADKIRTEFVAGSPFGYTDLQGRVEARTVFFDDLNDFPSITLTAGPESREYLPGRHVWGYLTIFTRIFVRNEDNSNEELESIISDLERFYNNNSSIVYDDDGTVRHVTDIQVELVETDEGVLRPDALGELVLQTRYDKTGYY